MPKVRIEVTKRHIAQARKDPKPAAKKCPINRALLDMFHKTRTSSDSVHFVGCDVPLPKAARSFIDAFDFKYDVKPFGFFLTVPPSIFKEARRTR